MSKKNGSDNNIVPNLKKLPLAEYFAALPKAERRPVIISAPKEDVITAIVEATQRNRHTVRCWMYGYTQPNSMVKGEVMITDECGTRQLEQSNREFISEIITRMGIFWPEALEKASLEYTDRRYNIPWFEFSIVRRFLKCNFGEFDSTMDIDQMGNFHFEEVKCPLKGECKYEGIICKPKFNSTLSERELSVMRSFYEGMEENAIADKYCISLETVRTHKRNAFRRIDVHSLAEFFQYARKNNLFQ